MAANSSGAMNNTQGGQHEMRKQSDFNLTLLSQDTWTYQRGGGQGRAEQRGGGGIEEGKRGLRASPVSTKKVHRKSEASFFLFYLRLDFDIGLP
jgi:hypothetical protein